MRKVRTKRTGVERRVRTLLRRKGVSFRGNVRSLPGTPDLIFWQGKGRRLCEWLFLARLPHMLSATKAQPQMVAQKD
jgi:hypothetical protein